MSNKPGVGVYPGDEETAKQIKTAPPKRRTSVAAYCEGIVRNGLIGGGEGIATMEGTDKETRKKLAFLARVERLRKKLGPTGVPAADLVRAGRCCICYDM